VSEDRPQLIVFLVVFWDSFLYSRRQIKIKKEVSKMITVRKENKMFLKNVPQYEEWHGMAGRTLVSERLFVLCHEGSLVEVDLKPTYRIGANYAYYPIEEGKGEDYETSIKEAGFDPDLKTNSFLIIQREFKNWNGEVDDEITIVLVTEDTE
jgi:hypothetical protein